MIAMLMVIEDVAGVMWVTRAGRAPPQQAGKQGEAAPLAGLVLVRLPLPARAQVHITQAQCGSGFRARP